MRGTSSWPTSTADNLRTKRLPSEKLAHPSFKTQFFDPSSFYECVFLNAFETGSDARSGIGSWIDYYNHRRPHSTFGGRTPDEVYAMAQMTEKLAA